MHTPDGFLTSWVCVALMVASLSVLAFSAYRLKEIITKQKAYMMAALAAVIFGFQMLNFPITSGTSGHFIGAGIAAILLGPYAAVVILAVVLAVQAVVYGDGGMLALGANIFNMGIVASFTTYYIYNALKGNKITAGFLASAAGVFAASVAASVELAISGTAPFMEVLFNMSLSHIFIGFGEGFITIALVAYAARMKVVMPARQIMLFLVLGFAVTGLALPFASGSPDGMENIAINMGFYNSAVEMYSVAVFPGYVAFGSTLAAGLIGMVLCMGVGYVVTRPLIS